MIYSYATLKELAKQKGVRVTDLIVLSRGRDPFYCGSHGDIINGKWFTDIWNRFGYITGVHLRRILYQIVSQEKDPIILPGGQVFENCERHWKFMLDASEKARYLGYVDCSAFEDRRNPMAKIYNETKFKPGIVVNNSGWVLQSLPLFPDLPDYEVENYQGEQGYILELWCEKSTMNDVFEPIAERYRVNLQTGLGEMSITAVDKLFERVRQAEHPVRIGYASDFDPGGQSMPVAVARKLEFFLHSRPGGNHDVKLFPLVLSLKQTQEYRLPRTPIKEGEQRKAGWEKRYGEGATELDALEALRPGELEKIIVAWIGRYYDADLGNVVDAARNELESALSDAREEVIEKYKDEIEELRKAHHKLRREFDGKMKPHAKKLTALIEKIASELQASGPNVTEYPVPEAADGNESGDALYDSDRNYFEQLSVYKEFQGRESVLIDDGGDDDLRKQRRVQRRERR